MDGTKNVMIWIILILSLIIPVTLALTARAADEDFKSQVHQLKEIVVAATRAETCRHKSAANISVITREDIEKMPASNAAEVLQHVPGVYVEFSGGLGSYATATIQGCEVRHVAVYQDGVPLNQLANPLTDLSYLPVDTIERIEVYKGAASSAWGSSLGGVINIITKEPNRDQPFAADARTSYGEFNTSKSRGAFSGTLDRLGYLLSLTHDESNGFMEHTEYEQDVLYAKINYELGQASCLNFAYSYDEGCNGDPLLNYPDFWDDIYRRRTYQRLLFEGAPVNDLILTMEGRHHRFYTKIDDVYSDHREVYNDYLDETWGVGARVIYTTNEANSLNLGFDQDWGRYDWNNYAREYDTRNRAIFANDTFNIENFTFNAGIRYDDNRDFGCELSPSAGLVYRFSGMEALIRAQVARGFSAPPASWVHDPRYGNPDLKPETAMNYQLGGEVSPCRLLKFEVNLFRADIEDLIRENQTTRKPENIDKVTRQGLEGTISATFDFGLALSFGGSFVDVKDDTTGRVIKDIPRTMYHVSASYTHKWMTHSIVGKYIDNNSTYPETRDQVFIFDYLLKVNLPFPERYGKLQLFGAVYNLANSTYIYRKVWPKPGRWIEGGLRFEL